jgi:hypothetical protein
MLEAIHIARQYSFFYSYILLAVTTWERAGAKCHSLLVGVSEVRIINSAVILSGVCRVFAANGVERSAVALQRINSSPH